MQNCYQMSSLDAHAMSAEEESMLVGGARPTFLSIPRPPTPEALCHTGVENWTALIPASLPKGLGHSVDDAEAVGRGVLGKICPRLNQSG